MDNEDLRKLFLKFDNCPLCRTSNNKLHHILGGGQSINPKVVFVFINPTHTNISSHPSYQGRRFPFIGVTHFWQVLRDSGWIEKGIIENIKTGWNKETINAIEKDLINRGLYITNLVKCTSSHGNYPEKKVFNYHLPLFEKELKIVKPKSIISFGTLTTKLLSGRNVIFKNYFKDPQTLRTNIVFSARLYPCWFPVGRGKRKFARGVLRELRFLLE